MTQQPNITIQPLDSDALVPMIRPQQTAAVPQIIPQTNFPAIQPQPIIANIPAPSNTATSAEQDKISYVNAKIQEIEVAKIAPNPFQPRKVFEQAALKELADSIKEHGVIQPLVVTVTPVGYELVVGERRFRAAQLAGLEKVPAIIKEAMVDQTKLEVALIENIQRKELNPIEEAQAYERLMKTFNLTQDEVAKKVGKSRPAVANTVRLLNLPAEIQRGVVEGKITEGHARAILGMLNKEKMLLMYKLAVRTEFKCQASGSQGQGTDYEKADGFGGA
jgi:ParB/RepB/Spo0J family partition protein